MTTDCEEVSHEAMHDDLPVREYRVRDEAEGERYSRWLCDACAHELEECGLDLRGVEAPTRLGGDGHRYRVDPNDPRLLLGGCVCCRAPER